MEESSVHLENNVLHLHEMFRIIGDQLTEENVTRLKSMFSNRVFSSEFLARIHDGFTFLLALEKADKIDESNFRQLRELLRIINRRDLFQYVTLKKRKTVKSDPIDDYLESCAHASTVIPFSRKRASQSSAAGGEAGGVAAPADPPHGCEEDTGAAGPAPSGLPRQTPPRGGDHSHPHAHPSPGGGGGGGHPPSDRDEAHALCAPGCKSRRGVAGDVPRDCSATPGPSQPGGDPTAAAADATLRGGQHTPRVHAQEHATPPPPPPPAAAQSDAQQQRANVTSGLPWQPGNSWLPSSPRKRRKRSSFGTRKKRKRGSEGRPSGLHDASTGASTRLHVEGDMVNVVSGASPVPISSVGAQVSPAHSQTATGAPNAAEIRKNVTCDIRLRVRAEYCHHDNALEGHVHSNKPELLERQFEKFMQANTILKSRDLGSIICDIKFSDLIYLDAFWRDYINGSLLEALKGVFITDSLKQAVGHEAIKLLVNVDEDDYDSGRLVLLDNLKG